MRGITRALELPVLAPGSRIEQVAEQFGSGRRAPPGMDAVQRLQPTSTALPMTARSISACTASAARANG
jgi:hypothetical protein